MVSITLFSNVTSSSAVCSRDASINCSQMWANPLPPSFWSHPDIFPTFPRDTWPNIWVGSNPGDIKGDGNYRFQAFWPRISGSQTVGVAGLTGGVTGPRRDSEKKKNVGRLSKVPQRIAACLSGSEQPARRIFLMIRKDIFQIFFFQDGERGDKC